MDEYKVNYLFPEHFGQDVSRSFEIPSERAENVSDAIEQKCDTYGFPPFVDESTTSNQSKSDYEDFTEKKRDSEFTTKLKKKTKRNSRANVDSETRKRRRSSANERERKRMKILNAAFDHLRNMLPSPGTKQLSKYDTLLMSQSYIRALQDMLK